MCSRPCKFVYGIALSMLVSSLAAMEQQQLENLVVYIGPMWGGKTGAVIDEIWEARLRHSQSAVMFKINPSMNPKAPSRETEIFSHENPISKAKKVIKGFEVLDIAAMRELIQGNAYDVVGIDEAQFADKEIFDLLRELNNKGKKIIVAGLYYDFRHKQFGKMPAISAMSKLITQFVAHCAQCGKDAGYSQRLVNGKPATNDDPTIILDGESAEITYEPRCEKCYVPPK